MKILDTFYYSDLGCYVQIRVPGQQLCLTESRNGMDMPVITTVSTVSIENDIKSGVCVQIDNIEIFDTIEFHGVDTRFKELENLKHVALRAALKRI